MTLAAGTRLGPYEILSPLGAGGMGEVYLAEDTKLRRKVALKILPADLVNNGERLHRFEREARAASRLNHPNILTVHEIGAEGDTHFIAAEYVEGESLRAAMTRNRFELGEVLDVAAQIASALAAAHAGGIVHRDIKPENVMLRGDGLVKVLDFGLAKLTEQKAENPDSEAATRALIETKPGAVMGTAAYMSPEQARGKDVDTRTDVWSFGVVLYEILAGRLPFEGDTPNDYIASILKSEPLPLDGEAIPNELKRIVRKSLRKDGDARYQTMKGLLADLKDLRDEISFAEKLKRLERSAAPETTRQEGDQKTLVADAQTTDHTRQAQQTASGAKDFSSEIKPRGFGFVIPTILLLAAIGLGYWYLFNPSTKQIESIAVLPFENASGNADLDYLSDGVSESVIDRLAQLPQLKVIARSSSFRYRGANLNLPEIAGALGVDAIVTGRVVRRDGGYMIRVDVTDVRENKQLWGENFNRQATDAQLLQTDIAREIAENLRLRLSGAQTRQLASSGTTNPQAYELLLKGRFHFNKAGDEEFNKAVEYYEQAIALDPNYALAYAELAEGYNYNGGRGFNPQQIVLKQEAAARRALELDTNLAEAHYAVAAVKLRQWQWREAEREYLRAIELNPNLPQAYRGYSAYLSTMRRHDEAIAKAKRARDLDPLSPLIASNLGRRLYSARRFDEAIEILQKRNEVNIKSPVPHYWLGSVYAAKEMYREAIAEFQESLRKRSGDGAAIEALVGVIYAKTGERAKAEEILERVKTAPREAAPPNLRIYYEQNLALLYDALDRRDEAFATLEKAYAERNPNLPTIGVDPAFDDLRPDPRFRDLMRRMGLPE